MNANKTQSVSLKDFEHTILDIALSVTPTNQGIGTKHNALTKKDAEYKKLNDIFSRAAKKIFKDIPGDVTEAEASPQMIREVISTVFSHPLQLLKAQLAAKKMHRIFNR